MRNQVTVGINMTFCPYEEELKEFRNKIVTLTGNIKKAANGAALLKS